MLAEALRISATNPRTVAKDAAKLLDYLRPSTLQGGPYQRIVALNEQNFLMWRLVLECHLTAHGPNINLLGAHPTPRVQRERAYVPE